MNHDEILNMPAGREMDALIAKKVMGLQKCGDSFVDGLYWLPSGIPDYPPEYSSDMSAAWQVVESLRKRDYRIFLSYARNIVTITLDHDNHHKDMDFWIEAKTAPLAICRAALLAVMENQK